MSALKLYEVTANQMALADKLAAMDLDEQTIADTLEGELAPFEDKAKAVAAVVGNIIAESDAYAEHAKKVAERAKTLKSRADWLKFYLLRNMQAVGVSEIKGPGLLIKLQDNPESVELFDISQIPELFMRRPPQPEAEPDKAAIKDALKAGAEVPGARLSRTQRITIK